MRVLVAAASRHGATAEMAAAVAERLGDRGLDCELADLLEPRPGGGLEHYDAVILGSAVYAATWLSVARDFVEAHAAELAARPVWLFSSGPLGDSSAGISNNGGAGPEPAPMARPPRDVPSYLTAIGAIGHHLFAGRLDHTELRFGERFVAQVVDGPDGDFRNWGEVRAWADGIADTLLAGAEADGVGRSGAIGAPD